MQEERFDAVIIGSGQGGNPLAKSLAKQGWKTAIIERWNVGGTCVNVGCTPTKTIVASARVAYLARRGTDFGVHAGDISINLAEVIARKAKVVEKSRASSTNGLEKSANLELIRGEASFAASQPSNDDHAIAVRLNGGGERLLITSKVILDTGERNVVPKLAGLDSVPYLDSTSILELQTLPEHLIILGAGTIALEFAQIYRRFGSRVTLIERGHRFLPHEDEDVAQCLLEILREDGIEILFETNAVSVSGTNGDITLHVEEKGSKRDLRGTHLLVAVGRTPNVEDLHLERAKIAQGEHGHIQVNDRLESTAKGVWAVGDVKGGPAFTHVSYDDFRILEANLLRNEGRSIKGRILTYVVFTDPELARVGINEDEAKKQGLKIRVAAVPMTWMARANEMAESRGMIKAIVDAETNLILGATVLGIDGGEVAAQIQIAIMGKLPYTALRDAMLSHPTKSEVLNTLFSNFRD